MYLLVWRWREATVTQLKADSGRTSSEDNTSSPKALCDTHTWTPLSAVWDCEALLRSGNWVHPVEAKKKKRIQAAWRTSTTGNQDQALTFDRQKPFSHKQGVEQQRCVLSAFPKLLFAGLDSRRLALHRSSFFKLSFLSRSFCVSRFLSSPLALFRCASLPSEFVWLV